MKISKLVHFQTWCKASTDKPLGKTQIFVFLSWGNVQFFFPCAQIDHFTKHMFWVRGCGPTNCVVKEPALRCCPRACPPRPLRNEAQKTRPRQSARAPGTTGRGRKAPPTNLCFFFPTQTKRNFAPAPTGVARSLSPCAPRCRHPAAHTTRPCPGATCACRKRARVAGRFHAARRPANWPKKTIDREPSGPVLRSSPPATRHAAGDRGLRRIRAGWRPARVDDCAGGGGEPAIPAAQA